ncbi:hypothetical protein FGO68_gene3285 [Halteria grandinella]|uniref:Vta1/callose synthase N-terminal domain-containing protein n=1 Tax=Halteria grandinella TaxID=5974 RepID=A0A8J8T0L8_HALGN|nr:hypothetical protein FGO68_gene3285 [Halteria grandinella]
MKSSQSQPPQQKSIIRAQKPFFRYAMELKQAAPLISFLCQKYGVLKAQQNIQRAEKELISRSFSKNLEKMQVQLQIDMTKQFVEQQAKVLEKTQLHIDDHRTHIENFVQAMIMDLDEKERDLIAQKDGDLKDIAMNYYRCAHFIELFQVAADDQKAGLTPEGLTAEWQEKREYCLFKAGFGRLGGKYVEGERGEGYRKSGGIVMVEGNIQDAKEMQQVLIKLRREFGLKVEEQKIIEPSQKAQLSLSSVQPSVYEYKPKPQQPPQQPSIETSLKYPSIQTPSGPSQSELNHPQLSQHPLSALQTPQPMIQKSLSQSQANGATYHYQGPPLQQPQQIQYRPTVNAQQRYADIQASKKLLQNTISELDYSNVNNAVAFLKQALQTLSKHETQ